MAAGGGSPCGACKFLRRKCAADCIFAPYFSSEQGAATFAAIHKIFGASNASKLLSNVPVPHRFEATLTIAYEAQARIRDPVYGCVAHVFALQQQVACLQAQLMQMKAQLPTNLIHKSSSRNSENQWLGGSMAAEIGSSAPFPSLDDCINYSISPQSSLDSIDGFSAGPLEMQSRDDFVSFRPHSKKRSSQTDLSELQELALRMMKDEN